MQSSRLESNRTKESHSVYKDLPMNRLPLKNSAGDIPVASNGEGIAMNHQQEGYEESNKERLQGNFQDNVVLESRRIHDDEKQSKKGEGACTVSLSELKNDRQILIHVDGQEDRNSEKVHVSNNRKHYSFSPPLFSMPSPAIQFQATLPLTFRLNDAASNGYGYRPSEVKMDPCKHPQKLDNANTYNTTCTCKNSKCLKLYCKCFANQSKCHDQCRCLNCMNDDKPEHQIAFDKAVSILLHKNPDAFQSKFCSKETGESEGGNDTRIVGKGVHKFGCKCRRSGCLKKYCECFNAGVKCSTSCRCVNCKNGRIIISSCDSEPKNSRGNSEVASAAPASRKISKDNKNLSKQAKAYKPPEANAKPSKLFLQLKRRANNRNRIESQNKNARLDQLSQGNKLPHADAFNAAQHLTLLRNSPEKISKSLYPNKVSLSSTKNYDNVGSLLMAAAMAMTELGDKNSQLPFEKSNYDVSLSVSSGMDANKPAEIDGARLKGKMVTPQDPI